MNYLEKHAAKRLLSHRLGEVLVKEAQWWKLFKKPAKAIGARGLTFAKKVRGSFGKKKPLAAAVILETTPRWDRPTKPIMLIEPLPPNCVRFD